jgi:acetylornithine deacetylase/succinyl-diaminopimelate desuccinylase-like protein
MFAFYPERDSTELSEIDWTDLRAGLEKLRAYVRSLQDDIEGRIADGSTINAELRFDLVSQLAAACRDTGLPIARPYVIGKTDKSTASQIIGAACKTITGTQFSIDHHLRDVIKLALAKKSG